MKYEAFLSYARVPDMGFAVALEQALQGFAKPWNRLRAIDVFRDESNLPGIGGLARSIAGAMDDSEFLILLACPESARSYWVAHEVGHWLEARATEKLIIVVTGGATHWNRDGGDFDWDRTDALPACLRGRFDEEPLWLDARWARGVENLSIRDARFHELVAEISAIVRGISKEQLFGEDVRQHRKLRTLQRAAVASLAVLTIIAGAAALTAFQQRNSAVANANRAEIASKQALDNQGLAEANAARALANEREAVRQQTLAEERRIAAEGAQAEAERQRAQAVLQRNRAESRALASLSLLSLAEDVQLALSLAVEAHRALPTDESRRALRRAVIAARALPPDEVTDVFWEGSRTDTADVMDDAIRPFFARSRTGTSFNSPGGERAVSVDGCCVITVREQIDARPRTLTLTGHADTIEAIAFDRTGRYIVSGAQDLTVRVWSAITGQQLDVFAHDAQVIQVAFSVDGSAIIANSRRSRKAWQSRLGRASEVIDLTEAQDNRVRATKLNGVVISPGGDVAALWGWHGVVVLHPASPGSRWTVDGSAPAFSPDGRDLAVSDASGVAIYRLDTHALRTRLPIGTRLDALAYSPDGRRLATVALRGPITVWDLASRQRVTTLPATDRISSLLFDRAGRHLLAVASDGSATLWNLAGATAPWSKPRAAGGGAWFGPDDAWVMLVPASGPARMIDRTSGSELTAISHRDAYGGQTGALDPGKKTLALGSQYAYAPSSLGYRAPVTLWHVTSATARSSLERTLVGHSDAIASIGFSPDGRWLVTGGLDDAVLVWDVTDGEIIDSHLQSTGGVFRAVFAGDGHHIVIGDRDGRVRVHDCVPCDTDAALVAAAQSKIIRPLSPDERKRYLTSSGPGR